MLMCITQTLITGPGETDCVSTRIEMMDITATLPI